MKAVALPVLPVLGASQHQHDAADTPAPPSAPYVPQAFSAEQFALLGALVDVIIPRTDTPGAADARVDVAIDEQCVQNKALQTQIAQGLARLEGARFGQLNDAERIAVVKPLSDANDGFFRVVKNLTVDAYYSSREGLTGELGWHANTFVAEFKGCTHAEHQG